MAYYIDEDKYLAHYGKLYRSGRYPWGSGEDPYQRLDRLHGARGFLKAVNDLKKEGHSEAKVAEMMGFETTTQLRAYQSMAKNEKRKMETATVLDYRDKGMSNKAIAEKMGMSETQVRNLQKENATARADKFELARDAMRNQITEDRYLDVSAGTENAMKVTPDMKKKAIAALEAEGYETHNIKQPQMQTEHDTTVKVLCPPGTTKADVYQNMDRVKGFYGDLNEEALHKTANKLGLQDPIKIDPKRVDVVMGDDGGAERDGMIFVRPGAKDLDMGGNHYAQVRIKIGDNHYAKGMAVLSDDIPAGKDLVVFSNKNVKNKLDALKPIKDDEDNPFGAVVKQLKDDNGNVKSALNMVNQVDDWEKWSKNLPAQMLSKQNTTLAKSQLELSRSNRESQLDEIMTLTNPVVKKHMLLKFSESADAAAVDLKASALPGQKTHVLLPVKSLKDNEIHAPNYKNGERVVLVRFPHGGQFEIPELVVNNSNKEAGKLIGKDAKNAVGINSKVAARLSGADFDGDTALVIPNNSGRVSTRKPLAGLVGFDPQTRYPLPKKSSAEAAKDPRYMSKSQTQQQMGKITNLIADMQLKGATDSEVARAVRHSMVVIDAEKHQLDWKQSEADNGIAQLKKAYQGKKAGGASTIITRASSDHYVDERRAARASEGGSIDPKTGKLRWKDTGAQYEKKKFNSETGKWEGTGKVVKKQTKITKMEGTDDARTLMGDDPAPVERVYADYANSMKGMANKARREAVRTPNATYSPSAAKQYKKEVDEVNEALNKAKANAPREREAQRRADLVYKAKVADNPGMEKEQRTKIKQQALTQARRETGANKDRIVLTDSQWKAVQAGAFSNTKQKEILTHADQDKLYERALPKSKNKVNQSKISRMKAMKASGYTQAEIAEALGVSASTVNEYL